MMTAWTNSIQSDLTPDVVLASSMPSRLTRADVDRIAALAHLDLTPEERELFTKQLADVLDYAERLLEVNTDDVSVTWHPVSLSSPLRDDEVCDSLSREDALANAPDSGSNGLFKVPKVIG